MFPVELKKVFDTAVKHSIEQIPALTSAFKEGEFDLKSQIDNEMDFYLGCVIATILKDIWFMQETQDLQNNKY